MTQLTLEQMEALDTRGYITQLGFNAEANAKAFNKSVSITHMKIDGGLLADGASPVDVTEMVLDYGDESLFEASVKENPENPGEFIVQIIIPADHSINGKGYQVWGLAAIGNINGENFIYSYRRVEGDFKSFNPNGAKSYTFRLRFQTLNADIINYTVNPSIAFITEQDLIEHNKNAQAHVDIRNALAKKADKSDLANYVSKSNQAPNIIITEEHQIALSRLNVIFRYGEYQLTAEENDCDVIIRVDDSVDLDTGDVAFLAPDGEQLKKGNQQFPRARIVEPTREFRFIRINGEWFV